MLHRSFQIYRVKGKRVLEEDWVSYLSVFYGKKQPQWEEHLRWTSCIMGLYSLVDAVCSKMSILNMKCVLYLIVGPYKQMNCHGDRMSYVSRPEPAMLFYVHPCRLQNHFKVILTMLCPSLTG